MRPVAIVNDLLGGQMGERTFWNYMVEGIPGIRPLDHKIMNCSPRNVASETRKRLGCMPRDAIVIQNATFLDKVSDDHFTVAFLQDNLRAMGRTGRDAATQEEVLRKSQVVVTNSRETAKSYAELNPVVIPIGIDPVVFCPTFVIGGMREIYDIPKNKRVGIFVGDFTETKGWNDVKKIIDTHPEVFFVLVSKRFESYEKTNTKCFSRVSQFVLAELYNCADFFILGSSVETQCLAALEAGFCNLPVVMKKTGIFMDFTENQRSMLGVFDDDLSKAFKSAMNDGRFFSPRETLLSLGLGIDDMISRWASLLENI